MILRLNGKFKLVFFSFFSAVILAGAYGLNAPSALALTISPVKIELSGDPGKTVTSQLTLINEQNAAITFYTTFAEFSAQGESGTPQFTYVPGDLDTWISAPDKVTLAQGEHKPISFSIKIPSNADPGGHFGAIFFGTAPPQAQGSSQVSVGAKVGVLILLKVSGLVKQGAGVIGFSGINGNSFFSNFPVTLAYRFQNSGGDRVNPTGLITIKNTFGATVAKLQANPGQGNVLPASIRKFQVVWTGSAGDPPVDTIIKSPSNFFAAAGAEWSNFAIGRYSANLNLNYGSSSTNSNFAFYIFPWQMLLELIAILIIGSFILIKLIRRYNNWVIKRARVK